MVRLACASTGPTHAPTGEGGLAVLTFRGLDNGESGLELGGVQLPDDGRPPTLIEATLQDGHVVVGTGCKIYLPLILRDSASQRISEPANRRIGRTATWSSALLMLVGFPAFSWPDVAQDANASGPGKRQPGSRYGLVSHS